MSALRDDITTAVTYSLMDAIGPEDVRKGAPMPNPERITQRVLEAVKKNLVADPEAVFDQLDLVARRSQHATYNGLPIFHVSPSATPDDRCAICGRTYEEAPSRFIGTDGNRAHAGCAEDQQHEHRRDRLGPPR